MKVSGDVAAPKQDQLQMLVSWRHETLALTVKVPLGAQHADPVSSD